MVDVQKHTTSTVFEMGTNAVQIFDSYRSMVGTNCLFKYEFHNLDTNCKGENWVRKLDAQL